MDRARKKSADQHLPRDKEKTVGYISCKNLLHRLVMPDKKGRKKEKALSQ